MDRITRRRAILNIAGARMVYNRNVNECAGDEFESSLEENMEVQPGEIETGENVEVPQPNEVGNVQIQEPTNEIEEDFENSLDVADVEIKQPNNCETVGNSHASDNENQAIDESEQLANVTMEMANISIAGKYFLRVLFCKEKNKTKNPF